MPPEALCTELKHLAAKTPVDPLAWRPYGDRAAFLVRSMTPRHMALVANAFARGEVRAPLLFGLLSDQVLFEIFC